MILLIVPAIIFIISLVLALRSVDKELTVPEEIRKLKVSKKKGLSGVILFLKEKIVHYSSTS